MLKRGISEIVDDFKELSQMVGITKKKSRKNVKVARPPRARRGVVAIPSKKIQESSVYTNSFVVNATTADLTAAAALNYIMRMAYYDEYSSLASVFDEYRLLKVVTTFTPVFGGYGNSGISYNAGGTAIANLESPYFRLAYSEDFQDPGNGYTSIPDAYDRNAKIQDGRRGFKVTWTPRVDVGNGVFQESPWLSMTSAVSVDHVGIKTYTEYPAFLTAGLFFAKYSIQHIVHYQLRE